MPSIFWQCHGITSNWKHSPTASKSMAFFCMSDNTGEWRQWCRTLSPRLRGPQCVWDCARVCIVRQLTGDMLITRCQRHPSRCCWRYQYQQLRCERLPWQSSTSNYQWCTQALDALRSFVAGGEFGGKTATCVYEFQNKLAARYRKAKVQCWVTY